MQISTIHQGRGRRWLIIYLGPPLLGRENRLSIVSIIIFEEVVPILKSSQNVLQRMDDIEVNDSFPRCAFLIQGSWLVHQLELFLQCGFSTLGLTKEEQLGVDVNLPMHG